jgi:hypothetical protein
MQNSPKSESEFDRFSTPNGPSDRDLMIKYRTALESIVATYKQSSVCSGVLNAIATSALKTLDKRAKKAPWYQGGKKSL